MIADYLRGPVHTPGACLAGAPNLDVRAIRERVRGGTQESFGALIGVPAGTVRTWEQGRRRPTGAARVLLRLIDSDPELMRALLTRAARTTATVTSATQFEQIE